MNRKKVFNMLSQVLSISASVFIVSKMFWGNPPEPQENE